MHKSDQFNSSLWLNLFDGYSCQRARPHTHPRHCRLKGLKKEKDGKRKAVRFRIKASCYEAVIAVDRRAAVKQIRRRGGR